VINDKIYFTKQKTKGRPRLILNDEGKKTIEKLARIMCTDEEIANMLEVAIETLQAKHNIDAFMEFKKRGQSQGKASLRRMQFKAAENGNASLLIWLGKQYLGQTDKKSEIQTWQGEEQNDN
jgi:hypothetical protein